MQLSTDANHKSAVAAAEYLLDEVCGADFTVIEIRVDTSKPAKTGETARVAHVVYIANGVNRLASLTFKSARTGEYWQTWTLDDFNGVRFNGWGRLYTGAALFQAASDTPYKSDADMAFRGVSPVLAACPICARPAVAAGETECSECQTAMTAPPALDDQPWPLNIATNRVTNFESDSTATNARLAHSLKSGLTRARFAMIAGVSAQHVAQLCDNNRHASTWMFELINLLAKVAKSGRVGEVSAAVEASGALAGMRCLLVLAA